MQPFSRETIVDRRQPGLRWGAIAAGTAVAIGTWLVLQLFGTGVALLLLDGREMDGVREIGIGTTAWSVIALIAALVTGGYGAARLAGHHDRLVAGVHGVLVWAFATLVGFVVVSASVESLAPRHEAAATAPEPGAVHTIERALDPINAQLGIEGKPVLTVEHVVAAAHEAADLDGFDRGELLAALAERSGLDSPDVERALLVLGDRAPAVISAGYRIAVHRDAAVRDAERAGCAFLIAALALALALLAAIGGALLAARELVRRRGWLEPDPRRHTTAPYPVPPAPDDLDEGLD